MTILTFFRIFYEVILAAFLARFLYYTDIDNSDKYFL